MGIIGSLKESGGRFLRIGVVILAAGLTQRASKPTVTCTADQPLVVQRASGLEDDQLAALLNATTRHLRSTTSGGGLNQRVFNGTHGFVLQFNRDGVERLRSDYDFLLPFFDSVQEDASNAFVLNALFVPPSRDGTTRSDPKDDAVKIHVDNTVAITHEQSIYAHSVSVLYLSVPAGMRGGTLNLWRSRSGSPLKPDQRLMPSAASDANLIVFRGDAWHSVSAHASNDSSGRPAPAWDDDVEEEEEGPQLRVSLVLEQYRIPPQLYRFTTRFLMRVDDHRTYEYMMAMGRLAARWPYLAAAGLAWLAAIFVLVRNNASKAATDAPTPAPTPVAPPAAAPAKPAAPTPSHPPSSRSGSSKKKGKKEKAAAATDDEGDGGEGEVMGIARQLQFCTLGFAGLMALILSG